MVNYFVYKLSGCGFKSRCGHLYQYTMQFLVSISIRAPAGINVFKVSNENARTICEICWKLTIKVTKRHHDIGLVSLLLPLNILHTSFWYQLRVCRGSLMTIYILYICIIYILYIYKYLALCYCCGFLCQQKMLKTFPGTGYSHSEDGVVWLWHFLVNLYIFIYIYIYM